MVITFKTAAKVLLFFDICKKKTFFLGIRGYGLLVMEKNCVNFVG